MPVLEIRWTCSRRSSDLFKHFHFIYWSNDTMFTAAMVWRFKKGVLTLRRDILLILKGIRSVILHVITSYGLLFPPHLWLDISHLNKEAKQQRRPHRICAGATIITLFQIPIPGVLLGPYHCPWRTQLSNLRGNKRLLTITAWCVIRRGGRPGGPRLMSSDLYILSPRRLQS